MFVGTKNIKFNIKICELIGFTGRVQIYIVFSYQYPKYIKQLVNYKLCNKITQKTSVFI